MSDFEVRTLLPVKEKSGRWIYPTQVVKQEEKSEEIADASGAENSDKEISEGEQEQHNSVQPNLLQRYSKEQSKLKKVKIQIGLLCNSVTQDPENNMIALKQLLDMLQNPCTKLIVTEKKLLTLSLLHVFTDILPTYKIRTSQDPDKKVKLKKETRQLINYEVNLLRYYKKYLDCLQQMVNDMRTKKRKKTYMSVIEKKAVFEVGCTAVRCLCDLLVNRYYFNYNKTIVSIIIPMACSRDNGIRKLCCEGIEKLYKTDKLGETSLESVKQTVKIIKERKFNVPVELLRTFLSLKLQEAKVGQKEKTDMKKVRKQLIMMSRKEKRNNKKMQALEAQLRETEAQENKETKSKLQTETLKKIFWVYFHVLKDDDKMKLLASALEGLSTFAHLINLEFFDDLNSVLSSLMDSGKLSNYEKLHCMKTVFTILSGHAESLNIDPQGLYSHLYNILLDLQKSMNPEDFPTALECIDLMIVKRKKKITFNRLLAFMKRLCTVSLHSPLHFTIAALSAVRIMMINNNSTDILLDTEFSAGSGIYLPELEDPEYCNPGSSALWDLTMLLTHYNPVVSTFSRHILHACPIQGRLQLSDQLSKPSVQELLKTFGNIVLEHQLEPEISRPPAKRLCVRKNPSQNTVQLLKVDKALTWDNVNVDFYQHLSA